MTSRVVAALVAGLLAGGCAPLLTGSTDPKDIRDIMQTQNARGCLYARASATPWAQATIIVIGTWGPDPPPYEQCWQGLPSGIP